jgi:hypothetical protein
MRGRSAVLLVALALVAALAVALGSRRAGDRGPASSSASPARTPRAPDVASSEAPGARPRHARRSRRAPATPPDDYDQNAAARAWASVDVEELRKALPGNLYWTMSAPTKDPDVLQAREEERARWNTEYGKVLSNTATADEIDAYYARRRRLSNDYIVFAGHLLLKYGRTLPARDVALLKLAIKMHLARLEELPRQIAEAQARREEHDAVRRAWLEDQKALGADPR